MQTVWDSIGIHATYVLIWLRTVSYLYFSLSPYEEKMCISVAFKMERISSLLYLIGFVGFDFRSALLERSVYSIKNVIEK